MKKAAYVLSVALFLFSLHVSEWAEAKMIVTKIDRLNVREGPGLSYPVKKQLSKGQRYTVVQETNDWLQLKLNERETGWVAGQYVSSVKEQVKAAVDRLRVRSAPNSQSKILGYLKLGQTATVIETKEEWTKIQTGSLAGWVSSHYLTESASAENTQFGTVAADTLNVRAEPSQQAAVVAKMTFGQQVTIIGETGDWYQIQANGNISGWVYRAYIMTTSFYIQVLDDDTNIRTKPSLSASVQMRAKKGQQYRVIAKEGNWYKIELSGQQSGYIAEWVVSIVHNNNRSNGSIKNKTIVIDPGHGGKDSGTIGSNGLMEKTLTLKTARLLKNELQSAGANVVLTRENDTYVSLPDRVKIAEQCHADAFISIHYDSSPNGLASGMTVYYYDAQSDYPLGLSLDPVLSETETVPYRGVRFGDFHVIRETTIPSVLLELGYVSNPTELSTIASDSYQQQVTKEIVDGLKRYFSN
ncbi:SH3 domain-containing protein [Anoxybacteroides tepidamans]|uniref:SH3 domain-containing protein n=1 Tax=Anoxybacteroides tepidamans TaxID=265948 RepID=UPI000482E9CE|nr:SH3 domain-containing protein [Anoxybacillus tepidamans]